MSEETPSSNDLEIVSRKGFDYVKNLLKTSAPLYGVKDRIHFPYRESQISLAKLNISDLYPCALYVLKDGLARAHELRQGFLAQGIDLANMTEEDTHLTFNWKNSKGAVISPPIIERSEDDGGKLVVIDGLHRIIDARMSGLKQITVVFIENAAVAVPAYPVSWNEVKITKQVPPTEEKRKFRFNTPEELGRWVAENYARYMRGFDFPERTVLPLINRSNLGLSGDFDRVELHKTSDSAFISDAEGVLMVRKREDGKWALPSGGVDLIDVHPDSPWSSYHATCMRRELYEETGLIALRWQRLMVRQTERGRTLRFWRAEVADAELVPMRLKDYAESFNLTGGNAEIAELGVFMPKDIHKLPLYKDEYNLASIGSMLVYPNLPVGELTAEDIKEVLPGADISEWEAQSGIKQKMPDYEYYRRDFSALRSAG